MSEQTQIEGRRAVAEAVKSGRALDRLYVLSGGGGLGGLIDSAREEGAVIVECSRQRLDSMSVTKAHQGVIAVAAAHRYARLEDIFLRAQEKAEPLFVVVCDSVEDEGNLGAIIRSAEVAGAHGVIVPKRRSAGLSAVVAKASAGAVEHLPVARVPGVPACLRILKERNVWIYGTAADAPRTVFETDFSGAVAVVVGSEGRGISRLAAESCDFMVGIPVYGRVESLNVSAAAAVVLCQVARCRHA